MFKATLDEYSRNARLKPAFLVWIPLTFVAAFFSSEVSAKLSVLFGSLTALGLPLLLTHVGRDYGKKKEPRLYALWGGKPSVAMLRHAARLINEHTKARYHAKATLLMPTLGFPTWEDERQNPGLADTKYEAFCNFLIQKTRKRDEFPLLFQENVNYGFRRNLWGMKPLALSLAFATWGLFGALAIYTIRAGSSPSLLLMVIIALDTTLLFFWCVVVTPSWVKIAGNAYAERLLEAIETLPIDG